LRLTPREKDVLATLSTTPASVRSLTRTGENYEANGIRRILHQLKSKGLVQNQYVPDEASFYWWKVE
jgi:hypothetical protein